MTPIILNLISNTSLISSNYIIIKFVTWIASTCETVISFFICNWAIPLYYFQISCIFHTFYNYKIIISYNNYYFLYLVIIIITFYTLNESYLKVYGNKDKNIFFNRFYRYINIIFYNFKFYIF